MVNKFNGVISWYVNFHCIITFPSQDLQETNESTERRHQQDRKGVLSRLFQ